MIDSHCHLADEAFAPDLEEVIARARASGLERALLILGAGNVEEEARAERVLALWPDVRTSIGVHPQSAAQFAGQENTATDLVRAQLDRTPSARAIGEIGLDYHYDPGGRLAQQAVFRSQLRLALELDRPVVVHTREAESDTIDLLTDVGQGALRGVLHCFTGTVGMAQAALKLGFHVSFSGVLTFGRAEQVRAAAREVPRDRLLVETDCPYLAPVPYRGKRNEPAYLQRMVEALAAAHGVAPTEMAAQTTRNFHALFRP